MKVDILIFSSLIVSIFVLYQAFITFFSKKRITQTVTTDPPKISAGPVIEESRTFWTELLKWAIGTVGIGIAGIVINGQIQKTELDIKRMEADTNLLTVVTKTENLESIKQDTAEIRYLSFIKTFITTEAIKTAIDDRLETLNIISKQRAERLAQAKIKNASTGTEQLTRKFKDKFASADKSLLQNKQDGQVDINELKQAEFEIAGDEIKPVDSGAIATLNAIQQAAAQQVISRNAEKLLLVNEPVTKWCKEGYYVEFNTLRIGISDLNPQEQYIKVTYSDVSSDDVKHISDETLVPGQTYFLNQNDLQYQITLNYIAAAGRNPFKKAAYITVATYQRQKN